MQALQCGVAGCSILLKPEAVNLQFFQVWPQLSGYGVSYRSPLKVAAVSLSVSKKNRQITPPAQKPHHTVLNGCILCSCII